MHSQEDLLSKLLGNRRLLFIIGGVIIAMIILSVVLTSGKTDIQKEVARLASQTAAVSDFAEGAQETLNDSSLLSNNATTIATLTGISVSLNELADNQKPNEDATKLQTTHIAELATSLDNAKVINNYNTEYKRIITSELTSLASDMRAVGTQANATVRANLEAAAEKIDLVSQLKN